MAGVQACAAHPNEQMLEEMRRLSANTERSVEAAANANRAADRAVEAANRAERLAAATEARFAKMIHK